MSTKQNRGAGARPRCRPRLDISREAVADVVAANMQAGYSVQGDPHVKAQPGMITGLSRWYRPAEYTTADQIACTAIDLLKPRSAYRRQQCFPVVPT